MNWNLFSLAGYLSVVLWLCMPLLWVLHNLLRPRRWLCHAALVVGLLALGLAKVNSLTYVNRIEVDRSEEIQAQQTRQEAARKAAEEQRSGEVAQIRFAEDDADDFIDAAGMDETDRKYIESFDETVTPGWKQKKKIRSSAPAADDSVEGLLDPDEAAAGMDVEALEAKAPREPIMMKDKDKAMADRLDALNLKLIRWLLLLGVGLVVLDYLRRVNVYDESYFPLPLPSGLVNGFTPLPVAWRRPEKPRRSLPEELAWFTRRGDVFLYLTDDVAAADAVPEQLCRYSRGKHPVEVLRVREADPLVDDTFIFEALWYNRASFVVDAADRAGTLTAHVVEMLRGRQETRARVKQTVHLVWDLDRPMPAALRQELARLAPATGFSLLDR